MTKLFIVIPVYNEENNIVPFLKALDPVSNALKKKEKTKSEYDVEVVFANDGSKDKTLDVIKKECQTRSNIHYVSFSKNFGKESAFLSGLIKARKLSESDEDLFAVMDVDLQDDPITLYSLINEVEKGFDRSYAYQNERAKESFLKRFFALNFYKVFSFLTGIKDTRSGARDYSVFKKSVLNAIIEYKNPKRFFKGIVYKIGFKQSKIAVPYIDREIGTSKFNFIKLMKYALTGINAFSDSLTYVVPSFISFSLLIALITLFVLGKESLGIIATLLFIISLLGILFTFFYNKLKHLIIKEDLYIVSEESEK